MGNRIRNIFRRSRIAPEPDKGHINDEEKISLDQNNRFRHSNLHILYVSDTHTNKFSEVMFAFFLKHFEISWGFNHVRWTNLAVPPVLPRRKPLMDLPTSVLLIINNLGDFDNKKLLALRRFLSQIHSHCPFLILLNLSRVQRVLPQRLFVSQRMQTERIHKDFFTEFLSQNLKELLDIRTWACPKYTAKAVVRKCIDWLGKRNHPVAPLPPLPYGPAPPKPARSLTLPRAVRKVRPKEYEDLPLFTSQKQTTRLTKSLSDTNLTNAFAKAPHHRPEEPRYDAEYEDFRSRREMRRFVRRLREALRLRQLDAARSSVDGSDMYRIEGLSELTSASDVDAASEDYDGDDEDAEEREGSGLTGYTIIDGHVSAVGTANELEPVLFGMETVHVNPVAESVNAERVRPLLPVDSFETMFHNPTFLARPVNRAEVPARLISFRNTTEENYTS